MTQDDGSFVRQSLRLQGVEGVCQGRVLIKIAGAGELLQLVHRADPLTGCEQERIAAFRFALQIKPAARTEFVHWSDDSPAAGAQGRGPFVCMFLPQQQPVGRDAEQPAHLGDVGHVRVGLAAFPFTYRLTGYAQLFSQLLLGQSGLLPGQRNALI